MSAASPDTRVSRFVDRGTLRDDLLAGATTALVLVPQAMGYAMLAGLPPIAGLHAATLALVVYALVGSSSALAVGPVAMDSLLTAGALAAVTAIDAPDRLALAGLLALLVGLAQLVMGALRLGHLTNFLSLPVITGFTSAAAIPIVATQLPALLGIEASEARGLLPGLLHVATSLARTSPPTLAIGLGSAIALLVLAAKRPAWPRTPLVLLAATLVSLAPGFEALRRIGSIPGTLPHPVLATPTPALLRALAPHALTIAFVGFLEAHSVAKRYASRCGEPSPSRELGALGAANVASALSGGFPVTGGLGRSTILVLEGARTRFAGVVTALVVLAITLLAAPILARLPEAALAAVVVTSAVSLVDVAAMKRIAAVKPIDALWMLAAFAATLIAGFQWGIVVGVVLSLAAFLHESTRPHVALLGRIPDTDCYRNLARYPEAERVPGLLLVRIDAQLYFGNATFLRETMAELEAEAPEPLRAIVLDASGVNQLDASAAAELERLVDRYEAKGLRFALASVKGPVRDVLKRAGTWKRLGRGRLFLDVHAAVTALRSEDPPPAKPPEPPCSSANFSI